VCFRLSPIALVLGVLLQPRSIRDGGNRQVMGRCASHLPIDSTTHKKKYLTPININPPTSLSALRQNQSLRCRNARQVQYSSSFPGQFGVLCMRRAHYGKVAMTVRSVCRACSVRAPSIHRPSAALADLQYLQGRRGRTLPLLICPILKGESLLTRVRD
jgi:hypothetical protein